MFLLCSHHTQTTHWDCPRDNRQQLLIKQLLTFLTTLKEKITVRAATTSSLATITKIVFQKEEEDLACKRKLLLEKNTQLSPVESLPELRGEEEEEEGESQEDLYDDIMLLNDEVDAQDVQLSGMRRHYQCLSTVLQDTKQELFGENERPEVGAELSLALVEELRKLHSLMVQLLEMVENINKVQRGKDNSTTPPLHHMLQLPARVRHQHNYTPSDVCDNKLEPLK